MDIKTWWYDTKSTKWQIIIGTLLIGFVFIGTFAFLDTYQFEEWEYSGFTKSLMGILMGTVALGVITGIIIIFQSIVAMDREKNQKIFDERLELYKDFTKNTMSIVSDNLLDLKEREQLKVIEKQILMIASPETYKKWMILYKDILELRVNEDEEEDEDIIFSISDKSIEFINSCRQDLEIGVIDKQTIAYSKSESRSEIRKGSKVIYGGIDEKLRQLIDESLDKKGINAWELIWRRLEEVSKKENKYKITFAKTGCGFYNDELSKSERQLIWINNPGKTMSGFVIKVKNTTTKSEDIYNNLVDKYDLKDSENIHVHKDGKLEIKAKLFDEVRENKFNEIAQYCLDCILD